MRSVRRQRLFVFGGASLVLGLLMAWAGYATMRSRLYEVGVWTDYLGKNERQTLSDVIDSQPEPTEDPNLRVPGLRVLTELEGRSAIGERTQFVVVPSREVLRAGHDPLMLLESFWRQRGLSVRRGNAAVAASAGERSYLASTDPEDGRRLRLWRIDGDRQAVASASRWPEGMESLFPTIPREAVAMELGRPGEPGYSMMVEFRVPSRIAYDALAREFDQRGWESMPVDQAQARLIAATHGLSPQRYRTYRHPTFPLGCLMLVTDSEDNVNTSQALMALF